MATENSVSEETVKEEVVVEETTEEITDTTETTEEVTDETTMTEEVTDTTKDVTETTETTEEVIDETETTEEVTDITETTEEVTDETKSTEEITDTTEVKEEVTDATETTSDEKTDEEKIAEEKARAEAEEREAEEKAKAEAEKREAEEKAKSEEKAAEDAKIKEDQQKAEEERLKQELEEGNDEFNNDFKVIPGSDGDIEKEAVEETVLETVETKDDSSTSDTSGDTEEKDSKVHEFVQALIDKAQEHGINVNAIALSVGINLADYGFDVDGAQTTTETPTTETPTTETPTTETPTTETPTTETPTTETPVDDTPTEEVEDTTDSTESDIKIDTTEKLTADTIMRTYGGTNGSQADTFDEKYVDSLANGSDEQAASEAVLASYEERFNRQMDWIANAMPENPNATINHIPSAERDKYTAQIEEFSATHTKCIMYSDDELANMDPADAELLMAQDSMLRLQWLQDNPEISELSGYTSADIGQSLDVATQNYETVATTQLEEKMAAEAAAEATTETTDEVTSEVTTEEPNVEDTSDSQSEDEASENLTDTSVPTTEAKSYTIDVDESGKVTSLTLNGKDVNPDELLANAKEEFTAKLSDSLSQYKDAILTEEDKEYIGHIGSSVAQEQAKEAKFNERLNNMMAELNINAILANTQVASTEYDE